MGIKVEIFTEGSISLPYKELTGDYASELTARICKIIRLKNVSISMIFTDNNYIQEINKEYRKKDRPTDVITFAYRENPFPFESKIEELGDIFISLEKALENSLEFETGFLEEIRRLIIHGVLHLAGYDHEKSKNDEKIMKEKEEEILNNLNKKN